MNCGHFESAPLWKTVRPTTLKRLLKRFLCHGDPGPSRKTAIASRILPPQPKELVEKRDAWLNPPGTSAAELKKRTLTNLYNQRPQWLEDAHRALDKAVLAAYGWPADLSDTDILERLLALNRERAGACSAAS